MCLTGGWKVVGLVVNLLTGLAVTQEWRGFRPLSLLRHVVWMAKQNNLSLTVDGGQRD